MLWRRADLDAAGGIGALARQSAEDAAATKLVRNAGLKVRLVARALPQPLQAAGELAEVWRRQLRWARLRRDSFKFWFLPELFTGGFLPLAAAAGLAVAGSVSWPVVRPSRLRPGAAEFALAASEGWPLSFRTLPALVLRDLILPVLGSPLDRKHFRLAGQRDGHETGPRVPRRTQLGDWHRTHLRASVHERRRDDLFAGLAPTLNQRKEVDAMIRTVPRFRALFLL